MVEVMTCAEAARLVKTWPEYSMCIDHKPRARFQLIHRAGLDWGPNVDLPDVVCLVTTHDGASLFHLDADEARVIASALIAVDLDALLELADVAAALTQEAEHWSIGADLDGALAELGNVVSRLRDGEARDGA